MKKINLYGLETEYRLLPSGEYMLGSGGKILRKNPKQSLSKKQRRKIRAAAKSKVIKSKRAASSIVW